MKDVIRFGLVGCGRIGATSDDRARNWAIARSWIPYSHASGIASVERARLVAVCDTNQAAAEEAGRRYSVSSVHSDHRDMLERQPLDAVAIATRTPERAQIILDCITKGVRGIYCEKPLCNTLEDADRISQAAQARKVVFIYGTRRRFMPLYHEARGLVRSGRIGRLTNIVVRFGEGGLFWAHPHSIDMFAFFNDDVPPITAQADLGIPAGALKGGVLDADPIIRMAHFTFPGGVTGQIVPVASQDVELCGTNGILSIRSDGHRLAWREAQDSSDLGWLIAERVDPPSSVDMKSGTTLSIEALVASLLDGKEPGYDVRAAVLNQEMLFALAESEILGGAKVGLPVQRRGLRITGRTGERFA